MITTKPLSAIVLSLLILTGSMSLGGFSNVEAQTSNLFVSADSSVFNNKISGPQVVQVVIRDQNISNTGEGKGEPDVTVNGKDLRMVQSTDGNWYGYFSDRKQAQIADSTVGLTGKGLDFGTFCSRNTSILGVSVSETDGIAIPINGATVGGENGKNPPNQISQDCSLSLPYSKKTINVVRQAKEMNPGNTKVNLGQIGISSKDLWPFIQLYDFSKGSNVIVQYNKGGGAQQTTLTFDSAEKSITHELDRTSYPRSSDVNLKIKDLSLNIDPTSVDSWSFGTSPTSPSTFYMLYGESGNSNSDGTAGAVNLIPNLTSMMFKDNGILKINPNVQGQSNVLTIKDNSHSQTNGNGEIDISLISSSAGSIAAGKQPVTITETSPNSGIFTTYDPNNDSVIITTQNAQRGTSASIEYNKKPLTLLIGFGKASLSLDEQLKGTEWNSGEEMPVILIDSDANKNNLAKEDLDLFNPSYKAIPALSTGNPYTLGESGTEANSKVSASFLDGFVLNPTTPGLFTLSGTNLGTTSTVMVEKFSDRARIDPVNNSDSDALVIDLKTNLNKLYASINNPFDSTSNFRGVNMFNFDLRSLNNTINNFDIYLLVGTGSSPILDSSGNPTPNITAIKIASDTSLQNLINLNSNLQVADPQLLHSNLFSSSFSGNEQIGLMFSYSKIQKMGTETRPIVADFFSYGLIKDGKLKTERIANQIVRVEVEELSTNSGKFRGSLEYIMLNQLNIFDPKTYEKIIPIDDEPIFLMIDELKGNDSPRISYNDLGTDGVFTAISDQQEVLAHMGLVVLSVKTFKPGDTVGVTLSDKDLNTNSDLIEIYTVVDPSKYPNDPAVDTVGLPNLGLTADNQPYGRLLAITFDDETWLKSSVSKNGKSCSPISGSDGLASTGFTLVETGAKTGEFTGNFKIPSQYCSRNSGGTIKVTTGVDIGARYYDFRGLSSQAAITSASAAVGATSGSVQLDRTSYPVPVGSVADFFNSGKSTSDRPNSLSIFPFHLTAITKNGDLKVIDSGEEIGPKDTVLYVRINDNDYNLSPNGEDTISQNIPGTSNGPVKVIVTRGSSSLLLATAGGEDANSGVITTGKTTKSGVTRELGPITETSPSSGLFQFSLPIRYVDGPSSLKCPVTPDSGFTKLDKTKSGVLSRFDVSPPTGNYCILQGDVITVEYSDQTDASGSQRTVTGSAAFDLRIGSLQSDTTSYVIGRDAIITLVDPDLNFDSKKAETHSLDILEWNSGNVKTTMGKMGGAATKNGLVFDSQPFGLRETGDSTGIFQTVIKIPSEINGKSLDRGESIKLTYTDWGTAGSDFVGKNDQKIEAKFFTSNFQSSISLDKRIYTWTDKVYVTIVAPDHNFNSNKVDEIGSKSTNEIKISSRANKLTQYKLVETGGDTGIFTGEVILTGFKHDADGNSRTGDIDGFDTNPRTQPKTGGGPTNGFLETKNDDGLTVSFQFTDRETSTASALIRWNIGDIEWVQGASSANGNGIIRVVDPDMNLNPETVNTFLIDVWSDSDLGGIDVTVTETGPATGIFEGSVTFSSRDQSSGHKLRVNEGDYVTAKYEDNTLPKPYSRTDELKITSSTTVGPVVPPMERAPVSNPRVVDSFGNSISLINVDNQVQISASIINNNVGTQPFTYLVQIQDSSNAVNSLSWITGTLSKGQILSPSVSWIPDAPGKYIATIFVWDNLKNPAAISPTVDFEINVS
ncbi:hypothetical protein C5F49_03340 [Nitrosopumilus oxyclinae]|uniref:Uncharacterized protein n=1 Tax=Nitrosopumilus oxyclinae TaxID=1959104 RepID=A0A7D5R358_9ARCH|nr:hypothetical protein [Nitrosopumilus oxyclinae]QLH04457.1 hypothetical protein C5F49_03340 [Nitrosopumilus oxyclinae]